MQILNHTELEQVSGGWSWKGAAIGGVAGAAGGSVGGFPGTIIGLGIGYVGGGLFGSE